MVRAPMMQNAYLLIGMEISRSVANRMLFLLCDPLYLKFACDDNLAGTRMK